MAQPCKPFCTFMCFHNLPKTSILKTLYCKTRNGRKTFYPFFLLHVCSHIACAGRLLIILLCLVAMEACLKAISRKPLSWLNTLFETNRTAISPSKIYIPQVQFHFSRPSPGTFMSSAVLARFCDQKAIEEAVNTYFPCLAEQYNRHHRYKR